MRLFGITMVRNEADIIEAFVRHNLAVLDGLAVIDHGSLDGTTEILGKFQDEGLPLRVARDSNPGFFQAERMTGLARETLARERADFVFALDADEFIKVESREELERALAELPPGAHAVAASLTYIPESFNGGEGGFGPTHLRTRLKSEQHGTYKSVVGPSFVQRQAQYLLSGNHLVDDLASPKPPPHIRLRQEVVALAHCPVRSRRQLESKIILGYLAHLATQPTNDKQAFHWRDLYAELCAGSSFTDARLREIASNYGLPRDMWQPVDAIELIVDPVPLNFELHYQAEAGLDTLRLLLRYVERLLRT